MEPDRLNFFQPFEGLAPNHENQLTRAFLLVLRLSPLAHESWLRRSAPGKHLNELPAATFATQRRAIRAAREDEEPVPVISVFLAPKVPLGDETIVKESERQQVLDAIISYGDALVMVIENKVAEASDEQARALNTAGANVTLAPGQEREVATWPDVIADVSGILERDLVGGAERAVLADFLSYVEDHFGELGPYRTLALCRGNAFRIKRRLRGLLGEATGVEARIDKWGPTVDLLEVKGVAARAYLFADENAVELSVYPADTLSQAREFYVRPGAVAATRTLAQQPEWNVSPNFHFGHMEAGYAWCHGSIGLDAYLDLWVERIPKAGAVLREDWDAYWDWLLEAQIATEDDRAEFDRHFVNTNRQKAVPRPGLAVVRSWSFPDAERLDSQGRLTEEVKAALEIAAEALTA